MTAAMQIFCCFRCCCCYYYYYYYCHCHYHRYPPQKYVPSSFATQRQEAKVVFFLLATIRVESAVGVEVAMMTMLLLLKYL